MTSTVDAGIVVGAYYYPRLLRQILLRHFAIAAGTPVDRGFHEQAIQS